MNTLQKRQETVDALIRIASRRISNSDIERINNLDLKNNFVFIHLVWLLSELAEAYVKSERTRDDIRFFLDIKYYGIKK